MSLFGAKKQAELPLKEVLKRAKENFEKRIESVPSEASAVSSSHIGEVLDRHLDLITAPPSSPPEIAQRRSELAHEERLREFHATAEYERLRPGEEQDRIETSLFRARIEDDSRRRENSQATPRVESGQLRSNLDNMRAYSDLTGTTGVTGITRYGSDDSSELSSPPTTEYGGSVISCPSQTPRHSTEYQGSIVGFPPSAAPQDLFMTPRASSKSILVKRYIQLEENISNDPSFRQKHPGVPDGSDGSDGTWYPLTGITRYPSPRRRVALHTYLLYFLVTYTHHQNDTCVTLFTVAAVMPKPFNTTPGDVYAFLRPPLLWECCCCAWKS